MDQTKLEELRLLSDGTGFLEEVVRDFLTDSIQILSDLDDALQRGSLRDFRDHAHSLSSSAANVGAVRVRRLSSELSRLDRTAFERGAAGELRALTDAFEQYRKAVNFRLAEMGEVRQPS